MTQYYFTFRSLTQAQTARRAAERRGIRASLLRTPRELSAQGCGYALAVKEETVRGAAATLTGAGISYEALYRVRDDGMTEEVIP